MMTASSNCRHWREAVRLRVCGALAKEEETQVDAHLAACVGCRRYSEELRATAAGLRWLASPEVEPSVGFRTRWRNLVEDAARPRTAAEGLAAWAVWWQEWLSRNLRPASAIAGLWLLTLLFRLSAPEASPPAQTVLARSPIQIMHVLKADQRLLAWHLRKQNPAPAPDPKRQSPQPRSSLSPARPPAHLDQALSAQTSLALMTLNPCVRASIPRRHSSLYSHESLRTISFAA